MKFAAETRVIVHDESQPIVAVETRVNFYEVAAETRVNFHEVAVETRVNFHDEFNRWSEIHGSKHDEIPG